MLVRALVSAVFTALLVPLARSQSTAFSDDFESGLANWTTSSDWHLQDEASLECTGAIATFPSGSSAAAFNLSPLGHCGFSHITGDLETVLPIAIPAGATHARLRFMSFEHTECWYGNCGWDDRYIQVSDDGGASWDTVALGGNERVWYERVVSLDAYIGASVLLRFRFDPVDDWGNFFPGWLIDDVAVEIDSPFVHYCTGKLGSISCMPTIMATGDVSLSGPDDLLFSATQLRNNVTSKFIWSRAPNNAPWGGGTLCVQAPAARTFVANSLGSPAPAADCSGTYSFPFTHAYLASKGVLPGETIHVQASTRDPGFPPPHNHGMSRAVAFTVTL